MGDLSFRSLFEFEVTDETACPGAATRTQFRDAVSGLPRVSLVLESKAITGAPAEQEDYCLFA